MRLFLRHATLAAVMPLAALAYTGCSSNEGAAGKMDSGAMDKDKMDGAMEGGKMDGAMDKGKMDGGAMEKGKMDGGAMEKGKMGEVPK